jgi:plastocyanin domain-containing protein
MMIINLMGLLVIALIVWWFWLYKPVAAEIAAEYTEDRPSSGDEGRNL